MNTFRKRGLVLFAASILPISGLTDTLHGFNFPESAIAVNDHLLVSNLGATLAPTAKDGDGFISAVYPDGEINKDAFDGNVRLDAPKGMGLYNDILYVADIDRLVAINLVTKTQVKQISFVSENVGFLNDVAISSTGNLYVSATDTGVVYKVDLNSDDSIPVPLPISPLPGPNGLFVDNDQQRLFIASFGTDQLDGELGIFSLNDSKYHRIEGAAGLFDGISVVDGDTVVVSDWGKFEPGAGEFKTINLKSGQIKTIRNNASGPADFMVMEDGRVVAPNMLDQSLVIETLEL
ncbi:MULTISPECIES: SMP-30/gluconolactonase/LRE family protein [Marinobacter]|uniref:SMP-30/Gluconolactonase/LRE-like region domain-containing protein n=1 Tax=Marinobacter profundi TaxID=2666256 RepID=A0A2G1UML4_9GAMM|nr:MULTISPECIES: hypothetical protein [Marinobacter]MBD3655983.1 hypothetical protein [Marinobacter sp.]PHQ15718.1 hypothetical protein CLH61_06080 [Marinobacter profundi]